MSSKEVSGSSTRKPAASAVAGAGLSDPLDDRRVHLAGGHGIETPISHAGGHGAGREDSRPDESPPIEINRRSVYLAAGNFVWLFQWNNNDLNFTCRLAHLTEWLKPEEKIVCGQLKSLLFLVASGHCSYSTTNARAKPS